MFNRPQAAGAQIRSKSKESQVTVPAGGALRDDRRGCPDSPAAAKFSEKKQLFVKHHVSCIHPEVDPADLVFTQRWTLQWDSSTFAQH